MVRHLSALIAKALLAVTTIPGAAARSSSREGEEAIKKIIVEMTEGFNKHDAKAATRMYKVGGITGLLVWTPSPERSARDSDPGLAR